jgi:PEP-CTERM motif
LFREGRELIHRIFHALAGIALAAAALHPSDADAALDLHTGDVVTFNADFTGKTPPPPYSASVAMQFVFSGADIGDQFAAEIFGGLNHSGTFIGEIVNVVGSTGSIFGFAPEMLDGVFSIRLTAQGDFGIEDVWAEARNTVTTTPDLVIPVTFDVPEPAGLALFGTTLALAAWRRRWRRFPAR